MDAVRRAVPARFPVGVRLNPGKTNDPTHEWPGGETAACEIFRSIVAAGASFLHISGLNTPHSAGATPMLPDLAKRVTSVAVIANGGLDDPARAEALLTAGCADLVSLGRGALANPDWPRRVAANDFAGCLRSRDDPAGSHVGERRRVAKATRPRLI